MPAATAHACRRTRRVIFKQMLQAAAVRYIQVDACRIGGLNEALAVTPMGNRFGKPVCLHAGGVGLCEYVDHLHEHFVDPCVTKTHDTWRR
jgi:L-fuconate dehydratase